MILIDLTGKRFGKLLVIKRLPNKGIVVNWECRCDCGVIKKVRSVDLRYKHSISCGCVRAKNFLIHGKAKTPENKIWSSMINRCKNPSASGYKWYGAKGVKVCKKWQNSFMAFLKDMGERPSNKHSIDRINPYGNYEPSNCRWATWKEQANNKRSNHTIEKMKGES